MQPMTVDFPRRARAVSHRVSKTIKCILCNNLIYEPSADWVRHECNILGNRFLVGYGDKGKKTVRQDAFKK